MSSENYQAQTSAVLADLKTELFSQMSDVDAVSDILEKIREWTGGQFFMTNLLCHYIVKYSPQIVEGKEAAIVDRIVRQKIVDDWENNAAAAHLKEIRDALLNYERKDALLLLYMQILQPGAISVDNSRGQKTLLQSGLVVAKNGKLKVANAIYADVFDFAWLEQQLPGITRPVSIVSPTLAAEQSVPSASLYPKVAAAVLGLAVLAAAVFAYVRKPESSAIATPNLPTDSPVASQPAAAPSPDGIYVKYKALFDRGMEHGQNGSWLPMLRDFCSISKSSTYFAPAERQLAQWVSLYPEDIELALDTAMLEKNDACPVTETILGTAVN
ncbi:hypothetical protein BH23CYA1_BH23CYA1_08490 [soil metagenome]